MAEKPSFITSPQGGGSVYPPGFPPEQKSDNPGTSAPAGDWLGSDWPVVNTDSSPATTGGYSPSSAQTPLPAPGSCDGCGLPPGGGYSGR